MTKYILHGGNTGRKTDDNKKFFHEITNDLLDPVRILCVYYAKEDKSKWPELFVNDQENFSSASPEKSLIFDMANDKTIIFIEQLKKADVIYMRGGNSTRILQEYLEKVPNLKNLWKGKVIAGSSAGAIVLSEYYYENGDEARPYNKGLGILTIKSFCHYTEDQSDKLMKLKEYGENVENVYTIPDEKFIIIER
jgi:peptidase E